MRETVQVALTAPARVKQTPGGWWTACLERAPHVAGVGQTRDQALAELRAAMRSSLGADELRDPPRARGPRFRRSTP